MTPLSCVHLNDDASVGGVTKSFAFHDTETMRAMAVSTVVTLDPDRAIAPRYDSDVIFTHFPPRWSALPFLASLRLRNARARLVHVEHSYTRAWETLKVGRSRRFRTMLRLSLALCDDVIAVSYAQADWLAEAAAIPRDRVRVLYPWSGMQALDQVRAAADPAGRPIRLGAFGRLAEAKGFDVLIAAMARLDPARFELVLGGFGPEEAALRNLAAGHANISFAGKVTNVGAFLARCDAIVVPSRWEAFGQVAAEAKLAGRPIVVAAVDGLPEQVGHAGLVVDCTDPAALATALARLDGPALAIMAAAARAAMLGVVARRTAGWQSLYADIAAARGGAPRRAAAPMTISAGQ